MTATGGARTAMERRSRMVGPSPLDPADGPPFRPSWACQGSRCRPLMSGHRWHSPPLPSTGPGWPAEGPAPARGGGLRGGGCTRAGHQHLSRIFRGNLETRGPCDGYTPADHQPCRATRPTQRRSLPGIGADRGRPWTAAPDRPPPTTSAADGLQDVFKTSIGHLEVLLLRGS
jgi:hypothetical protein